ncbi:MAG TPA: winged helix DNA-binding domain-containing protein [Puia sp.]
MQTTLTMTRENITRRRLDNQQVSAAGFMRPESLVAWLGCVQAQDFAAAKWAIGSRLKGAADKENPEGLESPVGGSKSGGAAPRTGKAVAWTDAGVQQAFNEGKILRTHILRPTWHFVAPADIRWMLALTAPRIKTFCAGMHRQLELDQAVFRRSNVLLQKALAGGGQLTRKELLPVFQRAKIRTDELRLAHLLMQAELDGVICSGAMSGKQFTYALMEERAPGGKLLQPEEAVAELALRYFKSRGPATLADFAWWSGLTVADGKKGVEALRSQFINEVVEGQSYWIYSHSPSTPAPADNPNFPALHVLPAFDEYTVAYKDRDLVLSPKHAIRSGNGIFKPILLCGGQIVGVWQRTIHKDHIAVMIDLFRPLGRKPVKAAFTGYEAFMEKRVVCHFG